MPSVDILAPAAFEHALDALSRAYDDIRDEAGAGPVRFAFGPAAGDAPGAIVNRLARPEGAQGVILPMALLERAEAAGQLRAGSRRAILVTRLAAAVPAGVPVPDLGTLGAMDGHLRGAGRIGLSTAGSGQFLRDRLFPGLPHGAEIVAQIAQLAGSVGEAVRDGRVDIGFQQYSELVAVEGPQVITAIAPAAQNATTIGLATLADAQAPAAVSGFAAFLATPAAAAVLTGFGLAAAY